MPPELDYLNQQIAHGWPFLVSQVTRDLQTALAHAKLGPLALSNVEAVFYLDDVPGFARFDTSHVSLAAPLDAPAAPRRWKLQITGYLNGDLFSVAGAHFATVTNKPFTLTVSNLQAVIAGEIDPAGDAVPRLKSLKLNLSLDIAMHSRGELIFSVAMQGSGSSQAWNLPSSADPLPGKLAANVNLRLGPLIDQADNAIAQANLTFDPAARPDKPGDTPQMLKLTDIHVQGVRLADLTLATPKDIADLFERIGAGTLPIAWPPEDSRPDPDPPLPGAFPFPNADLRAGADQIEQAIAAQHAPHGCVFNTTYGDTSDANTLRFYRGERDSAIWTGHYLAAEAFRYAATSGAERQDALKQAGAILSGIERLFQVPELSVQAQAAADPASPPDPCAGLLPVKQAGLKGLMCRAALPQAETSRTLPPFDQPLQPPPGALPACFASLPDAAQQAKQQAEQFNYYDQGVTIGGTQWFGFGRDNDPPSRDQLIGVMLGLGCAYKLIPDAALQARIKPLVSNLVSYLIVNNWHYPTPSGALNRLNAGLPRKTMRVLTSFQPFYMHQQLAFLIVGKMVDGAKFGARYDEAARHLAGFTWFPLWSDCLEPVNHYYKYNLHFACMGLLLFLETEASQYASYLSALGILRKTVGHHRNAYFNLLWILAHNTPVGRQAELAKPAGYQEASGGTADVAQETRILLSMWLERRRLTGGPNKLPLQQTPYPDYLRDLYDTERTHEYSGLGSSPLRLADFALPAHKRPGLDMDFMWQRCPFLTDLDVDGSAGMDCPGTEAPGVDYLLAYWLAAYLKVVSNS